MLRKGLFFILVLLALIPSMSFAVTISLSESILNFVSELTVNKDSSIDVTEKITVYANQDQIKHGIVRWLPFVSVDSYGVSHHASYQLQEVLVNNQPAPYTTQRSNNQFAIFIGNQNALLNPGTYIYTIKYHVNNAVNFLKDQDEIYWNVTGNNWTFPIDNVSVEITLPKGTEILNYAGYSGETGARDQNFSVTQPSDNQVAFATTKGLDSGEGLTVAVSWPKGVIQKPSLTTQVKTQIKSNPNEYVALEITLILFMYYLVAWYLFCRAPREGTIVPLFEPPLNLSPAAIRFISRLGFDMKSFTAAIVSMATKGFISIENTDKHFTLKKLNDNLNNLSDNEQMLAKKLFAGKTVVDLTQNNSSEINSAKSAFTKVLEGDYQNIYFVTNYAYLLPGLLFSLLAFAIAINVATDRTQAFYAAFWLSIWIFACYTIGIRWLDTLREAFTYRSFGSIAKVAGTSIIALAFFIGLIVGLLAFSNVVTPIIMALLLIIVMLNIIFYHLFKIPTVQGRNIMDHIAGFKMFLTATEQDRLDRLNPPQKTPQLFEKYLPYAIALDVENQWGEQFNNIINKSATPYTPTWYVGPIWSANTPSTFSNHLNTHLTTALNTASSSASSGVGFSGGGSGGGGGSGW